MLYKEPVRTALQTLSASVVKTELLMLYKAKVAVCSENTHTDCNRDVERILMLNLLAHEVLVRLQMINMHNPFSLSRIMIFDLLLGMVLLICIC